MVKQETQQVQMAVHSVVFHELHQRWLQVSSQEPPVVEEQIFSCPLMTWDFWIVIGWNEEGETEKQTVLERTQILL